MHSTDACIKVEDALQTAICSILDLANQVTRSLTLNPEYTTVLSCSLKSLNNKT